MSYMSTINLIMHDKQSIFNVLSKLGVSIKLMHCFGFVLLVFTDNIKETQA